MSVPDMSLFEDTPQIAPPRIPGPPQHLLEEPPIWLHSTLELGALAALHVRVPAVRDHPAREELVVARVEVVLAQPEVVGESMEEGWVLEDDGTVRCCSTGEAGDPSVDVSTRCDLDIADREAERSEYFP
jgi:hypothetical protein